MTAKFYALIAAVLAAGAAHQFGYSSIGYAFVVVAIIVYFSMD